MTQDPSKATAAPRRHLGMAHAVLLALGMIMTTDTLKTAPTVALNVGTWHFFGLWVLGGLVSMIGALCYVEMATAFPDPGGDYSFLTRAYGRSVGLLFAWSRFSIMHTGWIALMAFMFSDYAGALLPLGPVGRSLFAITTVAAMTGVNLLHVRQGFRVQGALVILVALGFAAVVAAAVTLGLGGALPRMAASAAGGPPSAAKISVALIYIFLAYGGWSDAATLSAEVRDDRRGMQVAIVGSLLILMAVYLALNGAMMAGLGPGGLAHSSAPAADLMGRAFGPAGKALIVAIVGVSAIASINSTLGRFGLWDGSRGVPARAVLAEGGCAILLVIAGSFAPSGFNAMVDYMTPVYWVFIALSMGALILLRRRFPEAPRWGRTPLYPLFPASFLLLAVYMFVSSLLDLGVGALYGAGVMAAGAVVVTLVQWRRGDSAQA